MSEESYTDSANSEEYFSDEYYSDDVGSEEESDSASGSAYGSDLDSEIYEESAEESDDYHFHLIKSDEETNEDGTFCMPKHLCKREEKKEDKVKMVYNKDKGKKAIVNKSNKQKEVCSVNSTNKANGVNKVSNSTKVNKANEVNKPVKANTANKASDKRVNAAAKTIGGMWKK